MTGELTAIPRRGRSGRPARHHRERTLSRESIVDAALRIVDAEGVDAVTMRRVGLELGTGGASLYAHIDNKDELLQLVFDKVMGEVPLGGPADPRRWREQLKELTRAMYWTLLQHNDLARLGFGDVPVGPNSLRGMEVMLAIMKAGKLPDQAIAYGADVIVAYVVAKAYEGNIWIRRESAAGGDNEFAIRLQSFFRTLSPDAFPNIVSLADVLIGEDDDGEERFEFGLEILIKGLGALAKSKR